MRIKIDQVIRVLFCALFIFIPLESLFSVQIVSLPVTVTTVILLLLFLLYLTSVFYSKSLTKIPGNALFPSFLLLFIFLFDVIAVIVHKSSPNLFAAVESFFAFFLFLLASVIFFNHPKAAVYGLRFLTVVMIGLSILSLLQSFKVIPPFLVLNPKPLKIGGIILPLQRISPLNLPNGLYNIFNFSVLPLLFVSFIQKKKGLFRPLTGLIGSFLIISAIFVTQSRSSWIALIVMVFLFIFGFIGSLYRKNQLSFVAALGFISTVIILFILCSGLNVFYTALYQTNPLSVESRLHQYKTGWELLSSHPVMGIGHGEFQEVYEPLPGCKKQSQMLHNYFLNRAVGTGIVSAAALAILFLWMGFVSGKNALKEIRSEGSLLGTALFTSFIAFCVELSFFPAQSGLDIIWIYLALIVTYHQVKKAFVSYS